MDAIKKLIKVLAECLLIVNGGLIVYISLCWSLAWLLAENPPSSSLPVIISSCWPFFTVISILVFLMVGYAKVVFSTKW